MFLALGGGRAKLFNFQIFMILSKIIVNLSCSTHCPYMAYNVVAASRRRGVPQRFGRAINFQISTKLSAGIHPRLRETSLAAGHFSFF